MRSFISSFLSCLLIFVFLYVIIDIFGRLDELIKKRILAKTIAEYYLNLLPTILIQMSPMAILMAALHTFGGLARNNETTAIMAGGISLRTLARPVLLTGLVVSLLLLWLGEYRQPQAAAKARRIKQEKLKNRRERHIWKNVVFYNPHGRRFFLGELNTATSTARDIEITELTASGTELFKVHAKSARWEEERWSFSGVTMHKFSHSGEIEEFISAGSCKTRGKNWIFLDGNLKTPDHDVRQFSRLYYPCPELTEGPSELTRKQQMPDEMNYIALKRYIGRLEAAGFTPRGETVNLYNKLTLPFINLIIVLIGISLGIRRKRAGPPLVNFGEAFLITLLFYVTISVSTAMGEHILPPVVSSLLPNAIFLSIGAVLFRRIDFPA